MSVRLCSTAVYKLGTPYLPYSLRTENLDAQEIDHLPPRRARTRCRTAPAVRLNSRAVLSSGLCVRGSKMVKGLRYQFNVHLPATENETLLWRGNTRLLLYFLLDSR